MCTSLFLLFSSNTIYVLSVCIFLLFVVFITELNGKKMKGSCLFSIKETPTNESLIKKPPGPKPLPVIGNLAVLNGYEVPYQAFSHLKANYGNIISLQLGSVGALVVNGIENIKEVLIHKGSHFDGRPNFNRYHKLFCGNKENSLAFCDWSDMQRVRREMLIPHTFPKNYSQRFHQLNTIINEHLSHMMLSFERQQILDIKPVILETCANVFMEYFTSRTMKPGSKDFKNMVNNFDKIFFEINKGYAADFLPFLQPLHHNNMKRMAQWSEEIRQIILNHIVGNRFEEWSNGQEAQDYLESLIENVKCDKTDKLEWETALFALEDIVGGHAAVGNFLVKVFGYLVGNDDIQQKLYEETCSTLNLPGRTSLQIELNDRRKMPYTEATIMEALRMISSPIVPHVANQDSTVGGYSIPKDTLIFLNNYDLNTSSEYWEAPEAFNPSRFIKCGQIFKPDFFIPFGNGKRSCMGYKLVQTICFMVLSNTIHKFKILPVESENYKVQCGSLAMPEQTYRLRFVARY